MEIIFFSSKQDLNALNHLSKNSSTYKDNTISYLKVTEEERREMCFFLAEWLHHIYVGTAIREGLKTFFDYLSFDEIYGVKSYANQHLEHDEFNYISNIQHNLMSLTEISRKINLEGFWQFAMQDYRNNIVDLLEKSLDEYWAEQEYNEFLNLLQCFIELEETQINQLTITTASNGAYRLYDENRNDITGECKDMLLNEFPDIRKEDEKENDFLISLLIVLAPQKIHFYGTKYIENKNFLNTLQMVFANRIVLEEENPYFDL